jgi:hypothetical protein
LGPGYRLSKHDRKTYSKIKYGRIFKQFSYYFLPENDFSAWSWLVVGCGLKYEIAGKLVQHVMPECKCFFFMELKLILQ